MSETLLGLLLGLSMVVGVCALVLIPAWVGERKHNLTARQLLTDLGLEHNEGNLLAAWLATDADGARHGRALIRLALRDSRTR